MMQQAVSLTGHVADPNAHMIKWNLFTSLSSDEGQGLAILEAMSLGVPVLARCAAGVEDYLRDGKTGIAVRSSSPAEVAERLEWAFHSQDELKKIAARARRMVVQHYDWNAMLRRMEDIYTGV
jgi:glycosyltransferase involved in cell wall biosynthesis